MGEEFGLRKGHIFQKGVDMVWPVFLFVMMIILVFIVADSNGMFELKNWAPLFIIGLGVWGAFEIWQFIQALKYKVTLKDEGININGRSWQWTEIKNYQSEEATIGKDARVTLMLHDDTSVLISGALDGLPYVCSVIEKKIKNQASAS